MLISDFINPKVFKKPIVFDLAMMEVKIIFRRGEKVCNEQQENN